MEKILIIQLTRLGDGVQTLPVLKLLKRQRTDCNVTLLCVKEFSGIFSRTPFLDRLVAIPAVDVAPMRGREAFQRLSDYPVLLEEYDSVVNLTHNWVGGFFCRNVKGISKSGLVNSENPMGPVKSGQAKYLFASQKCRTQNLFNIVDMHSAMAGLSMEPVRNYMQIDDNEVRDGNALLLQNGLKKKGRLIAFQLGANLMHRAWPPERFAAVAKRLLRRHEIEIVLLGAGGEKELAQEMQNHLGFPVVDLVGKTGISELLGVLRQCSTLVSNDTGTIHLAAAAGVPTVGLFFSTAYFGETAPYGAGHAVLQSELPCSPCHGDQVCDNPVCRDAITVDAVEAVVEKMLGYRPSWGAYSHGLSVYISNFTPNGPLLYAPADPGSASERFLGGLVYRILWGQALGFTGNEPALAGDLLRPYRLDSVLAKLEKVSEKNSACINLYSQASRLLKQAAKVRTGTQSGMDQLFSINDILKTIEEAVLSSEDSILKYYHMLQMHELNCYNHHELIRAMTDAYAGLVSIVESFDGGIERLRTALGR